MAECRLHQVDRRAAIEGVGCMGMAQPMGGHVGGQPGAGGGGLNHAMHGGRIELALALGDEHRSIRPGLATELHQGTPDSGREQGHAGFPALAVDRDLTGIVSGLEGVG